MTNLILASSSPQRSNLLKRAQVDFATYSPDYEIPFPRNYPPSLAVQQVAFGKVMTSKSVASENTCILSADTIVVTARTILGKPQSMKDAYAMLSSLRGSHHVVLTGICAYFGNRCWMGTAWTSICMRNLPDEEIMAYVYSDEPLGKAGAYGIQGNGQMLVKSLRGRVDTVIGLDVALTCDLLKQVNYQPLPVSVEDVNPGGYASILCNQRVHVQAVAPPW